MLIKSDKERWKDIPNYKGKYQISSYGRVRSLPRTEYVHRNGKLYTRKQRGCILHQTKDFDNYYEITFTKNGHKANYKVHRLVAKAFCHNPDPTHRTQINHINENTRDNYYKNLQWCDPQYNNNYRHHIQNVAEHEKKHSGTKALIVGHNQAKLFPSLRQAAKFIHDNYGGQFKTIQTHLSRAASQYSNRHLVRGFAVSWYSLPLDKKWINIASQQMLMKIRVYKNHVLHHKSKRVKLVGHGISYVFDTPNDTARWILKKGYASTKLVSVRNAVSAVCRGKRKHCYGFTAKYIK